MIRTLVFPCIILLLVSLQTSAMVSGDAVTGRVLDAATGRPVTGANVVLLRNRRGDVSDRFGFFRFENLPIPLDTLRVTHIGYAAYELRIDVSEIDDTIAVRLVAMPILMSDVVITASRLPYELRSIAAAVDVVDASDMAGTRRHYMEDALRYIPGVFVQSRPNQDEARITMRGSGIRTNWGVRGMHVLINGFPLTDADGLTDIDAIDLAIASRIEVLRGPASSIYGTGSAGGVLNFITAVSPLSHTAMGYAGAGGYGFRRYGISASGTGDGYTYLASASYHGKKGYREQSGGVSRRVFGTFNFSPDNRSDLRLLAFWRSIAFDLPGSLTRSEFETDARRANETALADRWRKEKTRSRVGAGYTRRLGRHFDLSFSGYYGEHTTPYHPIFMVLEEDFITAGGDLRVGGSFPESGHRFTVGVNRETVGGGARYYENIGGVRGTLGRNERIRVTRTGIYAQYDLEPRDGILIAAGLRADGIDTEFRDLIGDGSFSTRTDGWSGSIGSTFRLRPRLSIYLSGGFGYEPPAITEIRGADFTLRPIRIVNLEAGFRYLTPVFRFSVSLFGMMQRNDIIPYTEGFQTKYRNADGTMHRGMEVSLKGSPFESVVTEFAYTLSDFAFTRDELYKGNAVPGIPPHRAALRVVYRCHCGFFGGAGGEWNDDYYLNDANTDSHRSYRLFNVFAGWERGKISVESSVENLLGEVYAAYVRINESNLRYFEPGDGRSLQIRLRVQY